MSEVERETLVTRVKPTAGPNKKSHPYIFSCGLACLDGMLWQTNA